MGSIKRPREALPLKRNLAFPIDDEWMIDENKMELIRVHKKMRQIKYDPKDGQTPVPLEFLDTTGSIGKRSWNSPRTGSLLKKIMEVS